MTKGRMSLFCLYLEVPESTPKHLFRNNGQWTFKYDLVHLEQTRYRGGITMATRESINFQSMPHAEIPHYNNSH